MTKQTYTGLDIGKFLCALLILFYHFFSEHGPVPGLIEEILSLYAVAVALFMIISGFLTFDKLQGIEHRQERWHYVLKQVKRIFTIYLLWSVVYLLYTVLTWDFAALTLSDVLWSIQSWIFNSTFYTIWFMPALAIGLIVAFWMTEKLPKTACWLLGILLFTIGSLTMTYSFVGKQLNGYDRFFAFSINWLGGPRGWLFYATPLLMLGKFAAGIKHRFKWLPMMLLSILSMGALLAEALILRHFVGHTGIDLTIMMAPAVLCILGFLVSIKIPGGTYSVWMRKMSVLIFMAQRIFLTVLPDLLPQSVNNIIFANNYVGAVIICGGTFLFAEFILLLSKKIQWMKKLY